MIVNAKQGNVPCLAFFYLSERAKYQLSKRITDRTLVTSGGLFQIFIFIYTNFL